MGSRGVLGNGISVSQKAVFCSLSGFFKKKVRVRLSLYFAPGLQRQESEFKLSSEPGIPANCGTGQGFSSLCGNSAPSHLRSLTSEFYLEGEGRDSSEWGGVLSADSLVHARSSRCRHTTLSPRQTRFT